MKLDHAEFISRHHKPDLPARAAYMPPKLNVWALVFVAIAYIVFCLVIANALNVEHHVLAVLVILFTGAFVGAYALQKIMRLFSPEEKERILLKEILEASRGARMITDGANNALITNSRFDEMVKDIGTPGYDSLVKLFASNEAALAHFRGLADQAHAMCHARTVQRPNCLSSGVRLSGCFRRCAPRHSCAQ